MTSTNSYACSGTSALNARTYPHLKLVYDGGDKRHKVKERVSRKNIGPKPVFVSSTLIVGTVMAIVLVGVAYLFVAGARERMVTHAIESSGSQTIHVAPGDDLWSIATRHGVEGVDTYDVVRWIKEHNNLSVSALAPGIDLMVPGSVL